MSDEKKTPASLEEEEGAAATEKDAAAPEPEKAAVDQPEESESEPEAVDANDDTSGEVEEQEVPEQNVPEQEVSEEEVAQEELQEKPIPEEAADVDSEALQSTGVGEEAAPARGGRVLAAIALLVALVASGGLGYLYYMLIYMDPLADVSSQTGQNVERLDREIRAELSQLRTAVDGELASTRTDVAERIAANESRVVDTLNEAIQAAPPSQREWKLAEAEYLLRIANHRVLMEQDSSGALQLLEAADGILADLDDFSLHEVRARLADEIVSLQQVPRDDLQGIYLRVGAIANSLDDLGFAVVEYLREERVTVPDQSLFDRLTAELKAFIRVRSLASDETIKPLLAPEEEQYLELNLRLALQQAQLAALKRQQAVYESSLESAYGWIETYMDETSARDAVLKELGDLQSLSLDRPLPDISGSLNELLGVRRQQP